MLKPGLTTSRGKTVFFLQMSQFDWSILVDAGDLEVMFVVLEVPHRNCLLKVKMYRQHLPFTLRFSA